MIKHISIALIILMLVSIDTIVFAQTTENEFKSSVNENDSDEIITKTIAPDLGEEEYLNEQMLLPKGPDSNIQIEGVFLENYASYYFSQLNSNFGFNYKNTCSYVAIAMLLSYYDTYWDDNIILPQYNQPVENFNAYDLIDNNVQSPGIKGDEEIIDPIKEAFGIGDDFDLSDDIYNYLVSNHSSTYFHFKLLDIGINQLNKYYEMFPRDIEDLLAHYLYEERGYSKSMVEIERKKLDRQEDMKAYIITQVTNNIPVIVCGGYWEEGLQGHSFIIYDYDANSDELYCHMGIKNGKTHVKFSTIAYSTIGGVISLDWKEFNSEHQCSKNYVDSVGETYCSCYFPCHPEHEHKYEASAGAENMFHVYKCGCVAENDTPVLHRFETVIVDNDQHKDVCIDCGYEREVVMHDLQYTTNNDDTHTLSCLDCGFMISEEHDYVTHNHCYEKCADCGNVRQVVEHDYTDRYVSKDNLYHYAYCICGSKQTLEHDLYETNGHVKCYDCTYQIAANHVHSYLYTPISGGRSHKKTCSCGISTTEMCVGRASIDGTSYCVHCGQEIRTSLFPLSVDDEEDAMIYKDDEDYTCCE